MYTVPTFISEFGILFGRNMNHHIIISSLVFLFLVILFPEKLYIMAGRKAGLKRTTQTTALTKTRLTFRETNVPTDPPSELGLKMLARTIVPKFVHYSPQYRCNITYPSGAIVNAGNILTLDQIREKPNVTWIADFRWFYTLMMRDADDPLDLSGWHTWMIVNIPGNDTACGDVIFDYGVPQITTPGPHHFVFLIYRQPWKMIHLENLEKFSLNRWDFKLQTFIDEYDLLHPALGNFFIVNSKVKKNLPKYTRRNLSLLLVTKYSTVIQSISVGESLMNDDEWRDTGNCSPRFEFNYDHPAGYKF